MTKYKSHIATKAIRLEHQSLVVFALIAVVIVVSMALKNSYSLAYNEANIRLIYHNPN